VKKIGDGQGDEVGRQNAPGERLKFQLVNTLVIVLFSRKENKDKPEAEDLKPGR
jgi:hypothetical protein